MTDALTIISPRTLVEAKELATTLSNANSMPAALKKSPADVLAIVMAGAELGLAPMQSIRGIMLIEGRPTLSADAMGALVRSSPLCEYLQCTETTAKVATFVTKRRGNPEKTTFSFSIEEAEQAGLTRPTQSGKPSNWHKYPKAMLRARALSGICRLEYGDLMLGVHDPDEIEAEPKQVASTQESRPTPPAAADVASVKADVRKRRNLADKREATDAVVVSTDEDERTVGWGKNAALVLADLDDEKVRWYRDDAEKKAAANVDDTGALWVSRYSRYAAELDRRATPAVAAVAEGAVSP